MASVTQSTSTSRLATDPLRNFKFAVSIAAPNAGNAAIKIGFMSVSGLNITISVIAYRTGEMNTTTQKMPGQADFAPIVLTHGVAVGTPYELLWTKQLFQVMQGTDMTTSAGPTQTGQFSNAPGSNFRTTVEIDILGHPVTGSIAPVLGIYMVYNAWPTVLSYSDLDAGANQLLIAQMTLAHEGWDFQLGTDPTTSITYNASA